MSASKQLPIRSRLDIEQRVVKAQAAHALFGSRPAALRLGRFEIGRWLGRGSMGSVYEAYDLPHRRRVALKLLDCFDARAIYELKREFRSLAGVTHPNLVLLHELFIVEEQLFFTMELVEGVAFQKWVRRDGEVDESRLRAALPQLARAVAAIHAAGKLHCDLKSRNALVANDGRVVLLDFGLVTEWERSAGVDAPERTLGTPAYLAPETVLSEARDWYAVGVMLFEALTGRLPFQGSPRSIALAKQQSDPPDPRLQAPQVPVDLSDLCTALMHRDPKLRAAGEDILRIGPESRIDLPKSALPPFPKSAFVGRERELAALADELTAAREGRGACVLLPGPSGIGKTALLERFAELHAPEALVLSGRCHAQESVPYKVFDGVMDALGAHLRSLPKDELRALLPSHWPALLRLFPVLGEVPSATQAAPNPNPAGEARDLRNQAFAALRTLLLRLSLRVSVVLIVDDLQWGDVDGARMLSSIFGPPDPPPILFIGAYRSEEFESEFMRALREERPIGPWRPRLLEVTPLPDAAAAALVQTSMAGQGELPLEALGTIVSEAGGVPFLIAELTRYFNARPPHERMLEAGVPSVERVIHERVAALPPKGQALLRVLSVAGAPLEEAVAMAAAGLASGERAGVSMLRNERMLRSCSSPVGDSLEPYHDRVRESVLREIGADELCALHASIAAAMERHAITDMERFISHHRRAGQTQRAGTAAMLAGHAAADKLAFNRAAELFAEAIELLPATEVGTRELHRHLGDALANAGRGAQAAAAYLAQPEGLDPRAARRRLHLAARQLWLSGQIDEALVRTREALADLGIALPRSTSGMLMSYGWQRARLRARGLRLSPHPDPSPRVRERLEATDKLAGCLIFLDLLGGAVLYARHLREALAAGDLEQAQVGLGVEVLLLVARGGPRNERRAAAIMPLLRSLAERIGSPFARGVVDLAESNRLLWSDRSFQDALPFAVSAENTFAQQCRGAFWDHGMAVYNRLGCLALAGDLREHRVLVADTLKAARARDDRFMVTQVLGSLVADFFMQDRPADALDLLEQLRPGLASESLGGQQMWAVCMMSTLMYLGKPDAALRLFRSEWPRQRRSPLYASVASRTWTHYYFGRIALAVYLEVGENSVRDLAWKTASALRPTQSAGSACLMALRAGVRATYGARAEAISMLHSAHTLMTACQAPNMARCIERNLLSLKGDRAGIDRVDAEFTGQGVVDPKRWVRSIFPFG